MQAINKAFPAWQDRFLSVAPGFRTGQDWKMVVAILFYVGLFYVLVFAPALGALLLLFVALLFDAWGARSFLERRFSHLRSKRRFVRASSWTLLVFLLVVVGTPIAFTFDYLAIPVSIGILAWWIVWRDRDPLWKRGLRGVAACLATPLAALSYWRRASGWTQVTILVSIFGALNTYGFLLFLWGTDKAVFGNGRYWLPFYLIEWFLVAACAFALSALVRFDTLQASAAAKSAPPAADTESRRAPASQRPWVLKHPRLAIAASLLPRLGIWSALQLLFLVPWILIVPHVHPDPSFSAQVFIGTGISVLPLAVTSVIALFPDVGSDRTMRAWIERHLVAAGASAVLLSLAITVSFALQNAQFVAEGNASTAMPFLAVTAFMAGISMSLSIRLGQRLRFRTNWTYAGTVTTIALLCLVTLLAIAYALDFNTPDTQAKLMTGVLEGAKYSFALMAYVIAGVVIGAGILDPGLRTFAASLARVREMLLPLVGFVAGYVLIVLLFGAVYQAVYVTSAAKFVCAQADAAGAIETMPCTSAQAKPTETDFMYFSINTALPLGYSRIKPADDAHALQWATAAELIVATSWIVVVFAAMLHALQERMIRKTTETQMSELALSVGQLAKAIGADGGRSAGPAGSGDLVTGESSSGSGR